MTIRKKGKNVSYSRIDMILQKINFMEDYTMKSIFEQNGGTYIQEGDYLIPNLDLPQKKYNIGKYGMLHMEYIKENHLCFYSSLLLTGNLFDYLEKIDCKARNEVERLISFMAEKEGVTEDLKAKNQLKWVGLMNAIKQSAGRGSVRNFL